MLEDDERGVRSAVVEDDLTASARLAVYRHHVLASLTAALAATYPVVCRLVDPRFFAYAADRYIRQCPPRTPCLSEYGASFAEFLGAFPACAHLVYLPDVARLEWAMNTAWYAPDAPVLPAEALRACAPAALAASVIRLHPAVRYLASPWPVDRIWRANQPGADAGTMVDLDAGGVQLEVRCLGEDVVFRALPAGVFAFRVALAQGRPLEEAIQRALAEDGRLDAVRAIRDLVDDELCVGVG